MVSTQTLSKSQARRVTLAAQGFADARPKGRPDARALRRVLDRIGLIQIDSVNVLSRAQYLPLYSRLGPYPTALLDRAVNQAPRRLFEYWAHVASLVPVETQPALRFRMERVSREAWGSIQRIAEQRPDFVKWVQSEVRERGPLSAREIEHDVPRRKDNWGWNWSDVKVALEWLFFCGEVASSGRNSQFERLYDVPERVFPAEVLAAPTPSVEDAHLELVRIAAGAHGVSTAACLRDYFRLSAKETAAAIDVLVDAGELLPVRIEGWNKQAYLHKDARIPRKVDARALVGPFDSLVFERSRLENIFDFYYRIEIYVPAPKRVHGYYVLPFLLGDRLVARVDLKADRTAGVLRVQSAHLEKSVPPGESGMVAWQLAAELESMSGWLGLSDVFVEDRGDLAALVRSAF